MGVRRSRRDIERNWRELQWEFALFVQGLEAATRAREIAPGVTRDRGKLEEALQGALSELRETVSDVLETAHRSSDPEWEATHRASMDAVETNIGALRESFGFLHEAIEDPPEDAELRRLANEAQSLENWLFWLRRRDEEGRSPG